MFTLNRDAVSLPADRLLDALETRIEQKRTALEARDEEYGKQRIHIHSYMENIGWPDLFGYDMNRFLSDPALLIEMELRQRIFWLDNSPDDGLPGLWIGATAGMYYDITLFGQQVSHTRIGVPRFQPHPISRKPDLSLIEPVDFRTSGAMPALIGQYEAMRRLAETRYDGRISVGFPEFFRGPLDVCIQLRGYPQFVEDTFDRPAFVHEFLERIVSERARWNRRRRRFLGIPEPDEPTTRMDDDWVNVPFLSPALFREFAIPAYRQLVAKEGKVTGFHTCGVMVPVVRDLLAVFPDIRTLDVSGWNDFEALDEMLDPEIAFWVQFKNTFVLTGAEAEHRDVLERLARLGARRGVTVCAQAIVKLHETYDEDLARLNRFIDLARETFARHDRGR